MDITDQVCRRLGEELRLVRMPELTADIRKDLGADSFDIISIAMAMEEEFADFDVEITDKDADSIKTVGELCDLIKTKVEARRAA